MNDDIKRLIRLQEIAVQVKAIEDAKAALPGRLEELDRGFEARLADIGGERLKHEELRRRRDEMNKERDAQAEKLKQAQGKLMQVSNPREYSAALNEIDTLKSQVSTLEDQLLEMEGQIEALDGPAAEADQRIEAERTKLEEDKARLSAEEAETEAALSGLLAQRNEIAEALPEATLRRFESVFRARGGVAVARVEKESCSACHVRLRPQVINLARRGDDMITCDSCRRILYVDDGEAAEGEAGRGAEAGR